VPFRNIKSREATVIRHKVLDLPRAPNCEQAKVTVVTTECASAPKRVIQAIAIKDCQQGYRLIVRLGLTNRGEQLCPAVGAWRVLADFVERGGEWLVVHYKTSAVFRWSRLIAALIFSRSHFGPSRRLKASHSESLIRMARRSLVISIPYVCRDNVVPVRHDVKKILTVSASHTRPAASCCTSDGFRAPCRGRKCRRSRLAASPLP
jgi:hypothetical protein